ncbi:MAG: hypothetical protein L6416_00540 [Candidatus Omnitrophica bacterium]|nr:hypothetical protein [Candidatus Omnitrophota bacterium]
MDSKIKKQEYRRKEKKEMVIFIIILIIIFLGAIFLDKKFKRKIPRRKFEGEVKTYDGSLQRNLTNPLGLE